MSCKRYAKTERNHAKVAQKSRVMRPLREPIILKRPELWADPSWLLHHDRPTPHQFFENILPKTSRMYIYIVPHPPHPPDLTPLDFWLFKKLKRSLRGPRFYSIEEIKAESKKVLKAIPERLL
ncbi:uncharacterized protein [Euwallacea fornicatus]|uniref:uncharacterized protein n=1 Tax=Euwallacea fornicatus TaxID=995702 RepID=UPI0033907761